MFVRTYSTLASRKATYYLQVTKVLHVQETRTTQRYLSI